MVLVIMDERISYRKSELWSSRDKHQLVLVLVGYSSGVLHERRSNLLKLFVLFGRRLEKKIFYCRIWLVV